MTPARAIQPDPPNPRTEKAVKIAFIHQNMPGQFKHLAQWFGQQKEHEAVFITMRKDRDIPGVLRLSYRLHRQPDPKIHHYLLRTEAAVLHGQAVVRALQDLQKSRGFVPDVVVGHSGWGETLFVKELFPQTRLLAYSEFYYRSQGADIGFDPSEPTELDSRFRSQIRNTHFLQSLVHCDRAWAPTQWQRSVHPAEFHSKIEVVHEGIDTAHMSPNPQAEFVLPNGRRLTVADEVVTYVARNLEPYRGFPTFIRALPRILEQRPNAQVVVVGGDEISYGSGPKEGGTWRQKMLAEVPFDHSRVHFLGRVPYESFRSILQISSAHIYLTYPFVLSWSMLEAMSCGCLIIGSSTPPVMEAIEDGVNGTLVDFFKPEDVADKVVAALADPQAAAPLRRAARETVLERYELSKCFDKQLNIIRSLADAR
jgi:glycosyltransferase involved in cell wall biosynthesis